MSAEQPNSLRRTVPEEDASLTHCGCRLGWGLRFHSLLLYCLVYIAESKAALSEDLDAVDTGVSREMASEVVLRSQILTTLKEKPAPELSLSSQDLEVGKN